MAKKTKQELKEIEHKLILAQSNLAALMAEEELINQRLEKELQLEMALSARASFKSFVIQAWELIDPGSVYVDAWYLDMICEHLEALQNKEIKNLIVQIPPRHSKSSICSTLFPAWSWLQEPSEMFITASATQKLVLRDAGRSRRLITSDWYQNTFKPDFELLKDSNQQGKYDNNKGGTRLATSVGGTLTGFGYSIGILDDVLKADDANSRVKIEKTLEWYTQVFSTRKNSPESRTIIIMQRLSENDPIGWELQNNEELWDNICLPMEYEEGRKFYSSLGWKDRRTQEGELLSPDRFPEKEIKIKKKQMGDIGWASQYQQNPVPKEGNIVKKDWIYYYNKPYNKFEAAQYELIIGSWDLTFTDTGSSFCVGQVWGKKGSHKYLLHQYREKMDVVQQLAAIRQMKRDFPSIRAILIEKKANGDAVIRMLQKEIQGLIAISPQEIGGGDKEVRLAACSPDFESGNVFFPSPVFAPWIRDTVNELVTFPRSTNDDVVDCMSQALNWFASKSGLSSINISTSVDEIRKQQSEEYQLFGKEYDFRKKKEASMKNITEASSQPITELKSIFS